MRLLPIALVAAVLTVACREPGAGAPDSGAGDASAIDAAIDTFPGDDGISAARAA
ncbi:MAG: hypothetical protein H7138_10385, partial [Myxococcales bacterium]|nr:hypothetical protein [Myxococcales bacterium]